MKAGRKPNIKKDALVLSLRVQGLTFKAISEHPEVEEDVKNVFYRYRRALAKLSTGTI